MKQTAFWREKNGEYRVRLKYSVPIFVEYIYKMERLEVSGAVRPMYVSLGVKRLSSYIAGWNVLDWLDWQETEKNGNWKAGRFSPLRLCNTYSMTLCLEVL